MENLEIRDYDLDMTGCSEDLKESILLEGGLNVKLQSRKAIIQKLFKSQLISHLLDSKQDGSDDYVKIAKGALSGGTNFQLGTTLAGASTTYTLSGGVNRPLFSEITNKGGSYDQIATQSGKISHHPFSTPVELTLKRIAKNGSIAPAIENYLSKFVVYISTQEHGYIHNAVWKLIAEFGDTGRFNVNSKTMTDLNRKLKDSGACDAEIADINEEIADIVNNIWKDMESAINSCNLPGVGNTDLYELYKQVQRDVLNASTTGYDLDIDNRSKTIANKCVEEWVLRLCWGAFDASGVSKSLIDYYRRLVDICTRSYIDNYKVGFVNLFDISDTYTDSKTGVVMCKLHPCFVTIKKDSKGWFIDFIFDFGAVSGDTPFYLKSEPNTVNMLTRYYVPTSSDTEIDINLLEKTIQISHASGSSLINLLNYKPDNSLLNKYNLKESYETTDYDERDVYKRVRNLPKDCKLYMLGNLAPEKFAKKGIIAIVYSGYLPIIDGFIYKDSGKKWYYINTGDNLVAKDLWKDVLKVGYFDNKGFEHIPFYTWLNGRGLEQANKSKGLSTGYTDNRWSVFTGGDAAIKELADILEKLKNLQYSNFPSILPVFQVGECMFVNAKKEVWDNYIENDFPACIYNKNDLISSNEPLSTVGIVCEYDGIYINMPKLDLSKKVKLLRLTEKQLSYFLKNDKFAEAFATNSTPASLGDK